MVVLRRLFGFAAQVGVVCLPFEAFSQDVPTPSVQIAKFDKAGRLTLQVDDGGATGCRISVWGGTKPSSVKTLITSSDPIEATGTTIVKTKKRYYCKKRTLFIYASTECYPVGAARSETVAVAVPKGNIGR